MPPSALFRPWDGLDVESERPPANRAATPAQVAEVTEVSARLSPSPPASRGASSPTARQTSPLSVWCRPTSAAGRGEPTPYRDLQPFGDLSPYLWLPTVHSQWHSMAVLAEEGRRRAEVKRRRDKKFACPKCPMTFSNRGQLAGHFRKHTGERPFGCDTCHKRFTRNEELTRHSRIHTGDRPFGCDLCGKRFGRKDHLNKHQRTHSAPLYAAVPHTMLGSGLLELSGYLRSGLLGTPLF